MSIQHGLSENKNQVIIQLLQVFLVGLTIGMMRTVIPGLAQSEFGLGSQQFFLLASFVVVFGIVKAIMNLFAGRFSDQYGRKKILIIGWIIALPIPFIILYAPNWNWIIAATLLLGVNQGLCWSMTINSKLDLAHTNQKGLVNGINEFSGYAALAFAGVITAYLAEIYGIRDSLFMFGFLVILFGLFSAIFLVQETLPWSILHKENLLSTNKESFIKLFIHASWHNKTLLSLNQAGLVEKFTDAIIWVFLPIFFLSKGLNLIEASAIIFVYGVVWGASQLITGPLSDKIGRKYLIVWGMWICGIGLVLIPQTNNILLWTLEAGFIGIGMAMLYPNLGASVADFSPVDQRATLLGIYRFWRDFGYAVGALALGIAAQTIQTLEAPFYLAALAMGLSGLYVVIKLPNKKPLHYRTVKF